MSHWYLIYTKPRQESVAFFHLKQQNYSVYLPQCQRQKKVARRYVSVTEPMFPRYLFIQLDKGSDDWGPLRSTRGVSHLVRFGGEPALVADHIVSAIQAIEQSLLTSAGEQTDERFKAGQRVFIAQGPFAGYEAVFEEKKGEGRCKILIELVSKSMRIDIDQDDLSNDFLG